MGNCLFKDRNILWDTNEISPSDTSEYVMECQKIYNPIFIPEVNTSNK